MKLRTIIKSIENKIHCKSNIFIFIQQVGVKDHSVEAILHYTGSVDAEPTTKRDVCVEEKPCIVLNCPFLNYPIGTNTICVLLNQLRALKPSKIPKWDNESLEYFLNFAFPGDGVEKFTPGAINGHKFEYPGVNTLFQNEQMEEDYDCSKKDCGEDKICHCHYSLEVPYNKTLQLIWLNMGSGSGWAHPIHMHGHSFYLLKMGYPPQDKRTGLLTGIELVFVCVNIILVLFYFELSSTLSFSASSWNIGNLLRTFLVWKFRFVFSDLMIRKHRSLSVK